MWRHYWPRCMAAVMDTRKNALVLRIQPHLRSYNRAARAFCWRIPKKKWPMQAFQDWLQNRNAQTEEKYHCPEDILSTDDAKTLAKWLSLFIMEVCKKDGTEYPPAMIHLLLCSLQRIMRRQNSHHFDIFAKKDINMVENAVYLLLNSKWSVKQSVWYICTTHFTW